MFLALSPLRFDRESHTRGFANRSEQFGGVLEKGELMPRLDATTSSRTILNPTSKRRPKQPDINMTSTKAEKEASLRRAMMWSQSRRASSTQKDMKIASHQGRATRSQGKKKRVVRSSYSSMLSYRSYSELLAYLPLHFSRR